MGDKDFDEDEDIRGRQFSGRPGEDVVYLLRPGPLLASMQAGKI